MPVDHMENISGSVSSKTAECWEAGEHITGAGTLYLPHSYDLSLASAINSYQHQGAELNGSMEEHLRNKVFSEPLLELCSKSDSRR